MGVGPSKEGLVNLDSQWQNVNIFSLLYLVYHRVKRVILLGPAFEEYR